MTTTSHDRPGHRISIVDDDPLRARKEARELLAEVSGADPQAALDVPRRRTSGDGSDKGTLSVDTVGVLISAGSLAVAGVQAWLARVPQRTIVVTRPDGATLHITGKEASEDDERIARFLSGAAGQHAHTPHAAGPARDDGNGPRPGGDDGEARGSDRRGSDSRQSDSRGNDANTNTANTTNANANANNSETTSTSTSTSNPNGPTAG